MPKPGSETIAAFGTAPGIGGIAVLRISGPEALRILSQLFVPAPTARGGQTHPAGDGAAQKEGALAASRARDMGRHSPCFRPRYMHFGHVLDKNGEFLDSVLAVFMPGPHSATGEDVAEIHCHGGQGICAALLEAAFAAGARHAAPGEFTRRAFLNGRMDLTQAEAVAELIASPTREGARLASAKLEGALGGRVRSIREALDALRIQIALAVDFPDEDAELLDAADFARTITGTRQAIARLLASFERARLWREGALAVLAGKVNAGKSSLLNALLGRERAIVSPEAGTTRDYIEESVNLDGLCLRLADTAGIRTGGGMVEAEGIRRSADLAAGADLLLFVKDLRQDFDADECAFLEGQRDLLQQGRLVLVLNKADLAPEAGLDPAAAPVPEGRDGMSEDASTLLNRAEDAAMAQKLMLASRAEKESGTGQPSVIGALASCPRFVVSARTGAGLDRFARGIRNILTGSASLETAPGAGGAIPPEGDRCPTDQAPASYRRPAAPGLEAPESASSNTPGRDIAPNLRQSMLLRAADQELQALEQALKQGLPPDVLSVHLEAAVGQLDDVTGSTSTEALLDSIFSSFCIGK
ncbi:tRNA uridine-5-carboxymethylaminomethyl(34) synthesis GTPase MnmE [Desulfovibrio sp. OttesenSCG-928-A18]|nr:tRNA uridine-5-carboxymethylaminomethyl(34) synthesis GTPase MnmE [Desulfovibrio sp. OttesenSCG-928-A18]